MGIIQGNQAITLYTLRFWPWNIFSATGIEVIANMKKPINPTIMPSFMFPFFKKIELRELPEIFVNRVIILVTIEALTNISSKNPLIVSDGMFTRKSKNRPKKL